MLDSPLDLDQAFPCHTDPRKFQFPYQLCLPDSSGLPDPAYIPANISIILFDLLFQNTTPAEGLFLVLFPLFYEISMVQWDWYWSIYGSIAFEIKFILIIQFINLLFKAVPFFLTQTIPFRAMMRQCRTHTQIFPAAFPAFCRICNHKHPYCRP